MEDKNKEDTDAKRELIYKGVLMISQISAIVYLLMNVNLAIVRNTVAIGLVPPLITLMAILGYSYLQD